MRGVLRLHLSSSCIPNGLWTPHGEGVIFKNILYVQCENLIPIVWIFLTSWNCKNIIRKVLESFNYHFGVPI